MAVRAAVLCSPTADSVATFAAAPRLWRLHRAAAPSDDEPEPVVDDVLVPVPHQPARVLPGAHLAHRVEHPVKPHHLRAGEHRHLAGHNGVADGGGLVLPEQRPAEEGGGVRVWV